MEEQKNPESASEAAPAPAPEAQPDAKAPEAGQPDTKPALPEVPKDNVTVTVKPADGSETYQLKCRFHTPTLLKTLNKVKDGDMVKIDLTEIQARKVEGSDEPELFLGVRTLVESKKEDAIPGLQKSVVQSESLPAELQKFAQFLLDHSELRAVGVSLACTTEDGKDAVSGFILTAPNCTQGQAVALVNCMDANTQEFVTKAKIEVPGRNAPKMGGLIIPTAEDKEKLGLK